MKEYIGGCILDKSMFCSSKKDCPHRKPHELNHSCIMGMHCDCTPLGLEYYMKKIIKEHEENK